MKGLPRSRSHPRSRSNSRPLSQRASARPFAHLAVLLVSLAVALYAMFAASGPSIDASELATANPQPQTAPTTDAAAPKTLQSPTQSETDLQALQSQPPRTLLSEYQSPTAEVLDSHTQETFDLLQQRLQALGISQPVGVNGVTSSQTEATPTAGTREDDCEPHASGLYCIYTVKPGDTLTVIANDFGLTGSDELSPAEMLAESNKPDVVDSDYITVGFKLRIPVINGLIHTVFSSESLDQVADKYGVSSESILDLGLNTVDDPSLLKAGQEILVPDPVRITRAVAPPPPAADDEEVFEEPEAIPAEEAPAPPPEDTPTPEPEPEATATATPYIIDFEATVQALLPPPDPTETPVPPAATATPSSRAVSNLGFIWPAVGAISSYFGPSHPLGIDIDLYHDPHQGIVAAADGVVTFAGGDPCCSYGYYVIIDHGDGIQTLYAHLSRLYVSEGEQVSQGEVLGLGGMTGNATGNHLHFEVHIDGAVVDPLLYLP